ncbi:hypothetical protein JCM16303_001908 [Sporobolomyces ruberrimus]
MSPPPYCHAPASQQLGSRAPTAHSRAGSPALRPSATRSLPPSLPRICELDRAAGIRHSRPATSVGWYNAPIVTPFRTSFSQCWPPPSLSSPAFDPTFEPSRSTTPLPIGPRRPHPFQASAPTPDLVLPATGPPAHARPPSTFGNSVSELAPEVFLTSSPVDEAAEESAKTTKGKTLSREERKAIKLPPSGCGVCATTETAEWRRGLPRPDTIALIEEELAEIGIERFKPEDGLYTLPEGSRARIHEAQRRTRAYQGLSKSKAVDLTPPSFEVASAAGTLVNFARRASASSITSPSGSSSGRAQTYPAPSIHDVSQGRLRFRSNSTPELPPSSSYMPPLHPRAHFPTFPSHHAPSFAHHCAPTSVHYRPHLSSEPIDSRSRLDGSVYPYPTRPGTSSTSSSLPTTSFDRLSLSRPSLPVPVHSHRPPLHKSTSLEAYSLAMMTARADNRKTTS